MADRLVVMSEGRVRQVGRQQDLYERPADRFVAGFVGRSTFLPGRIVGPGVFETTGGLRISCETRGASGTASLGLRPERLALGDADAENAHSGKVEFVSYLGAMIDVHVRLSALERVVVQVGNRGDGAAPAVGDTVRVAWARAACMVFAD